MPSVVIRQVDALARIMEHTVSAEQRRVLLRQADMLLRSSDGAIPEAEDRDVVLGRYEQVIATCARLDAGAPAHLPPGPNSYPSAVGTGNGLTCC
jgi:uncharacterized membrane protein